MNLVVDIGNSRSKVVVIPSPDRASWVEYVKEGVDSEWVGSLLDRHPEVRRAIISSTRDDIDAVREVVASRVESLLDFAPATTPMPLRNAYHTPHTLGPDRMAAAVGVSEMYDAEEYMIVDFGTAITIDYVVDGAFRGGNISPGMTTRFRALADYTSKLPLCSPTDDEIAYGRTTREAIEQGVMQGITHEIRGYITSFLAEKTKKCIIFSGGDAKYFAMRIKNAIFADCEPVIFGLNAILNYNADKR